MVLGERWPAKAISYLDPIGPWDSGFMVLLVDVPAPEDLSEDELSVPVCLGCLVDEHPELGRGLDLACSPLAKLPTCSASPPAPSSTGPSKVGSPTSRSGRRCASASRRSWTGSRVSDAGQELSVGRA